MKLGEFEMLLLNKVRELGPITPARLHEHLGESWPSSFSTLATTLRRLETKNLICARPLKGRSVEYWVDSSRSAYRHAASMLAEQIVEAFGETECPEWCTSRLMCSLLTLHLGKDMSYLTNDELDEMIERLRLVKSERPVDYIPPITRAGCQRPHQMDP